jgi:hypothetical protein
MAELGALLRNRAGSMNPNNNFPGSQIYLSSADTDLSIVQRLISSGPASQYGSLVGYVAIIESLTPGSAPSEAPSTTPPTGKASTAAKPLPNRGTAYVYIDVIHGSISSLLNFSNYKSFLTKVEILDSVPAVGSKVLVSFKNNNLSIASLVKIIDGSGRPLEGGDPYAQLDPRLKPCLEMLTPSEESNPVNVTNKNVGYFQALYLLARWQAKNTEYKITEVIFPFDTGDETSKLQAKISSLLDQFIKLNAKMLKRLENTSNLQKQWAQSAKSLTTNATYNAKSETADILVKYSSKSTAAKIDLSSISRFSSGAYMAKKNDDKSFFLGFGATGAGVSDRVALTQRNLKSFGNEFEKIIFDPVPKQTTSVSPSVTAINCSTKLPANVTTPGTNRYYKGASNSHAKKFVVAQGWKAKKNKKKKGYLIVDKKWEKDYLVTVRTHDRQSVKLNKEIAPLFLKAYNEAIEKSGYRTARNGLRSYVPRNVGRDPKGHPSTHSYGLAFDIDPGLNRMTKCKTKEICQEHKSKIRGFPIFIDIMNKYGFLWGGDFTWTDGKQRNSYPDDMHFVYDARKQKATG